MGSSNESSRHKSQGDMKRNGLQNENKTKFPTIVDTGVFFLVCCFVFFTPQVGVVSSNVGLACFEKTGGYRKYIMGSASRYLRSLLDADRRFPRRQETETTIYRCCWSITYCIGEP